MWRCAEIAFGLALYCVPCQCPALAWPFIVINRKVLKDEPSNSNTGRETESHFQLNESQRMWQGLRTICAFGNKSSTEVRADPLLADELNTFYGRF